ncbi:MAG TPA: molybdopterin-dependent oxidoreductase, partial [Noviherbaspirillum sp.]|nr:molybdopterin-dependent oxidoreductase [Noviherbaspirillum sp.]
MPFIRRSRPWQRIAGSATSQEIYLNRRSFLAALGAGAIGAGVALAAEGDTISAASSRPGVARKSKFELGRELTDATVAARYNNFYEFGIGKLDPARRAHSLKTTSWTIEIAGLVKQPRTLDLDDLLQRMPLEERLYRFRCVEAWALAAPWVGFPLQLLIDQVEPLSSAKFVRFVTADRPDQMPGIKEQPWLPWPY